MAVEDGCQHQGLVQEGVDTLLIRLDSDNAILGERAGPFEQNMYEVDARNGAERTNRRQANECFAKHS